ncbi:MAG TPA: hypothetical protein VG916_11210 [Gemmatimonadaceae bacterium]|nr:hypothetical protein [Gemmatimonadaceae bacterium]
MRATPHMSRIAAVGCAAMILTACGGDAANTDTRKIDLAPTKAAEPQLADAPLPKADAKAPVKAATAPAPKRSAPEPKRLEPMVDDKVATPAPAAAAPIAAAPAALPLPTTGTVAAGTSFTVKPAVKVCTNTYKVGDRFTATLANPVTGSNGAEIPAGSAAILRIVDASGTKSAKDSAHLAFDILSIKVGDQTYEVNAHVVESAPLDRVNAQSTTDKAKKVGAGAAIGAIAGRILGGNTKSTVLGGVVGAAAGAAVAAGDNHYEGCLSGDGAITLALDKPLVLKLATAP